MFEHYLIMYVYPYHFRNKSLHSPLVCNFSTQGIVGKIKPWAISNPVFMNVDCMLVMETTIEGWIYEIKNVF